MSADKYPTPVSVAPPLRGLRGVLLSPLGVLPVGLLAAWNSRDTYMTTAIESSIGIVISIVGIGFAVGLPTGALTWFALARFPPLRRAWVAIPLYMTGVGLGILAISREPAAAFLAGVVPGLLMAVVFCLLLRLRWL